MRANIPGIVLVMIVASTTAFCQDVKKERPRPGRDMERNLHFRQQQLDVAEREAELDFQQKMREIQLQKQRSELDFQHKTRETQLQKQRFEIQRLKHRDSRPERRVYHGKKMFKFVAICLVLNILLAIWVYQDIRERNTGSGMWIVITLLSGFFGVLVYAVVRLGDSRQLISKK